MSKQFGDILNEVSVIECPQYACGSNKDCGGKSYSFCPEEYKEVQVEYEKMRVLIEAVEELFVDHGACENAAEIEGLCDDDNCSYCNLYHALDALKGEPQC